MSGDRPLFELDPTGRFAGRAGDYSRYRPDYPAECIDAVLTGFDSPMAADIGAGTGISARMMADRGASVIAVEPNETMMAEAETHPGIRWVHGRAEATSLASESVDVVGCFQAFHWFEPERALEEFHRILKPKGRVALVWNERDRQDPLTRAYSGLVSRFAVIAPAEERKGAADPLYESPLFEGTRALRFIHMQALPPGGLVGRARSTSYLPAEGPAAEELWSELRHLEKVYGDASGQVRLRYNTVLHSAVRR